MEIVNIFEYLLIAVIMGVISYLIWDRSDKRNIKRGDEWD